MRKGEAQQSVIITNTGLWKIYPQIIANDYDSLNSAECKPASLFLITYSVKISPKRALHRLYCKKKRLQISNSKYALNVC